MSTWDSKGTDLVDNIEVDSYSTNGDMATATQDLLIGSTNKTTQGLWRKGVLVQIQGGVWSMETRLTADDLNMGVNQVPGFALLGKKRLLDA